MDNTLALLTERVREHFQHHGSDHDFYHIERVYNLAMHIQEQEGGDPTVIAYAALLHDVSDHKLNGGVLNDNGRVAKIWLEELHVAPEIIDRVLEVVDHVSYKGAGVTDVDGSLELTIVRDADRLDAIGAIGIARAFHFGGSRNRPFFVPDVKPQLHADFATYVKDEGHTINHFYEKLLLLKDRMQTKTAKRIAEKRHQLMVDFLEQFHAEWEGSDGKY